MVKNGRKQIVKIEPSSNFILKITFETGEQRLLFVKPLIKNVTSWSAPILDPEYFKTASIDDDGSLEWPNEFGWDWQTVYDYSMPIEKAKN